MDNRAKETLRNTLSYVYGLDSTITSESDSVNVIYIHKDNNREDADKAIEIATNYIRGRYPKMIVVVFDKTKKK